MINIIIIGPPGSGKGTQAKKLADSLNLFHFSTGDLIRSEIQQKTELGISIEHYVKQGDLVPDNIMTELVKQVVYQNINQGIVFDGYPRSVEQVYILDGVLNEYNAEIDVVILIDIDDETVVSRLLNRRICGKCGRIYNLSPDSPYYPKQMGICDKCNNLLIRRVDDTEEIILKRLADYKQTFGKVIEIYEERGLLRRVDGTQNEKDVSDRIYEIIKTEIDKKGDFKKTEFGLKEVEGLRKLLAESAPVEITMPLLKELLRTGYDTVQFLAQRDACEKCWRLNNKKFPLKEFIYKAKFSAPIYTLTHPGCNCFIKVTCNGDDDLEPVVMNYEGEIL